MPFFRGLSMTASMIIALGPQNLYLIKNGLHRSSKTLNIAAIYILVDIILISTGAIGVGSIISKAPYLSFGMTVFAGLFFLYFGLSSLIKSKQPKADIEVAIDDNSSYWTAIFISIVNPGVIFDTIVIVGGLAGSYELLEDRIIFTLGAVVASFTWFMLLTVSSLWASKYVDNANTWKIIEIATGVIMMVVGLVVFYDLYKAELTNPTFLY